MNDKGTTLPEDDLRAALAPDGSIAPLDPARVISGARRRRKVRGLATTAVAAISGRRSRDQRLPGRRQVARAGSRTGESRTDGADVPEQPDAIGHHPEAAGQHAWRDPDHSGGLSRGGGEASRAPAPRPPSGAC